MRIALIVGLLALLALAAGAFFLLSGDEELDFDPYDENVMVEDDLEGPRARRTGGALVPTTRENDESGEAETVEETDDAEIPEHAVLVIDSDEQPVVGARVEILAANDDPFARFRGDRRAEPEVVFSAVTGDDGIAPINVGEGRVRVRARSDRTYGSAEVNLDELDGEAAAIGVEAIITLLPVRDLEVAVVGPGGAPMPHVLVAVRDAGEGNRRGGGRRRGRRGWGPGRTEWSDDPTGLARFEINSDDDAYAAKTIEIRPQLPGFEIEPTRIELQEEGLTRTMVTVPESVAVALSLTSEDAGLLQAALPVRWLVTALADASTEDMGRGWFTRAMFGSRDVEGGAALIRGFQPGSTVTFRVVLDGRVPAEVEVELPPTASTEPVEIALGAERPVIVARLLDPDGAPVRRERFTAEAQMAGDEGQEDEAMRRPGGSGFARMMMRRMDRDPSTRTDMDGTIRIPVEPGRTGTLEFFAGRRMRMPWGGDESSALASVAFPALEPGAEHEAGDITLDRGPLLVSGRVVDGKEQPFPSVMVQVTENREDTGSDDPMGRMRRRGRRGGRGGPWGRGGGGMRARTAADGTFKIWGAAEAGSTYEIAAQGRGVVSTPVTFAPGEDEVMVVVQTPGTIEGSLAFTDPRFAEIDAEVSMRPSSSQDDSDWRRFRVSDEHTFRSRGLPAGSYDLRVRLGGRDAAMRRGIEVVAGESSKPAELQGLMVGGGLMVAEVRVVDQNSAPVRGARVSMTVEGEDFDFRRFFGGTRTDADGRLMRVLSSGATAKVTVRADGFANFETEISSFPAELSIVRGNSLRVDFGGGAPTVEGLRGYRVNLRPADEAPADASDPAAMMRRRMGGGGGRSNMDQGAQSVDFSNVAPGDYRVVVQLRPQTQGQGRRAFRAAMMPPELEMGVVSIQDGGGEQTAEFVLNAGDVESALADWQAQQAAETGNDR